jgi:hypothetical protein
MRTFLAAVLVVLGSTTAFADQSCDASHYPLSAPTARFTDNGDGTVTDTITHVMWMRCSLGQTWTGSTCEGTPAELPWQAAQDEAVSINKRGGFAKHADWRMPSIPELANIVEVQCANPRTNLAVFPQTPAAFYWTASNRRDEQQAFILSFGPQGTGDDVKTQPHYVRLMRGS